MRVLGTSSLSRLRIFPRLRISLRRHRISRLSGSIPRSCPESSGRRGKDCPRASRSGGRRRSGLLATRIDRLARSARKPFSSFPLAPLGAFPQGGNRPRVNVGDLPPKAHCRGLPDRSSVKRDRFRRYSRRVLARFGARSGRWRGAGGKPCAIAPRFLFAVGVRYFRASLRISGGRFRFPGNGNRVARSFCRTAWANGISPAGEILSLVSPPRSIP